MAATYTVGDSKTYSTIQAALDAIPGSLTGQGVQTVEVYSKAAGYAEELDGVSGFSGEGVSNYIDIVAMEDHLGVLGDGIVVDVSGSSQISVFLLRYTKLRGFCITCPNIAYTSSYKYLIRYTGVSDLQNNIIYNTVAYDSGQRVFCLTSYAFTVTDKSVYLFNNILAKCNYGGLSSTAMIDLNVTGIASYPCYACNNTFVNCTGSGLNVQTKPYWNIYNNYIQSSEDSFVNMGGSNCNINYNMSEDGTADDFGGTGNLAEKDASDQFTSVTVGSEDLYPLLYGDCVRSGQSVSGVFTTDIAGVTRDFWCTGAFEINRIDIAAALSGSGTLAASLSASVELSAALSGSGTLSAALGASVELSASLSGSGTLSAALGASVELSAALSGSGTLSAALGASVELSAALSGSGTLSASATVSVGEELAGSASLVGSGTLTATADVTVPAYTGVRVYKMRRNDRIWQLKRGNDE